MNDAVRFLCHNSTKHDLRPAECRTAAKRRRTRGLQTHSAELADYHHRFVTEYGARIVGGCCGTTPEHIKAVVEQSCERYSLPSAKSSRWEPQRALTRLFRSISIPSR